MQWYEILIVIAACAFVVGVVTWRIVLRLKGKGGCDCGNCSGCTNCPSCRTHKEDGKKSG